MINQFKKNMILNSYLLHWQNIKEIFAEICTWYLICWPYHLIKFNSQNRANINPHMWVFGMKIKVTWSQMLECEEY